MHKLWRVLAAFSLPEWRDTAFPSPQTPLPQEPSRDSSKPLGSSIKLLRLRSRGECLWHSFRSLAAYCSSSAHPRNICCVGFARMEMLAKYIRMRTARSAATASHPCVEHATEGINQYREQSFSKKINRSSRDSGAARQSAFFAKLSFSRKKAEWGDRQTGFAGRQTAAPYGLPGRSFHGVTGFCSSSAHPRNFCCVGFARMVLLAKFIRMRTARSHPRGARTRALNVPRRASTNIGNRAKTIQFRIL